MQLLNLFVFVGKEELFFPRRFKMPRLLRYRVVHPPIEFSVEETADGWFEVLRNKEPMLIEIRGGKSVAARFKNHHVAMGFMLVCEFLEKRFA